MCFLLSRVWKHKIVFIMRLTFSIILLCVLQSFATSSFSQNIRLSINQKNISVENVLQLIEDKTDYSFMYSVEAVDVKRTLDVEATNKSVSEILDDIFRGTDISYKINGRLIALSRNGEILPATQQTKSVSGKVTDSSGAPLPGVTIVVKGTAKGTITDADGKYSLSSVPADCTLQYSFVGMKTQEIMINGKTTINVTMAESTIGLDEVVAVGYGTQNRKSVTGAISTVKSDELQTVNGISIDNLLQGKSPGLTITQRSAQPGGGLDVNIRGYLSPRGSNEPLYVIDGVPISSNGGNNSAKVGPNLNNFGDGADRSPLSTINPSDIESIDILKDASATAIYGSAAANGVILITTKKGKSGNATVTYNGSYSFQKIARYWDFLNANQFMNFSNLASKELWLYNNKYAPYGQTTAPASGWVVIYPPDVIASNTKDYNHSDEIMRTGQIQDHNLAISGGTEKSKYYMSFNYFDQKSLLKTTDLKRYSGRINYDQTFNSWLKLNMNIMYTMLLANNPSIGGTLPNANGQRQTGAALEFSPRLPLQNPDGTLTINEFPKVPNPMAWQLIKDKTETQRFMFTPNLEIKVTPDLKANIVLGVDRTSSARDVFSPTEAKLPEQTQDNYGGYSNNNNYNYNIEGYLSYNKTFGEDNSITLVAGSGYYKARGNSYDFTVFNLPTDALSNNNLGIASTKDLNTYDSWRWARTKISQFGRLNYSYKDKYILGLTARNDGSSAFPPNKKWGFFPGISGAWIVSQESFLQDNKVVNYLKVRGGWGTSGNESAVTNNFYYLTQYGAARGYAFYFGGTQHTGLIQTQQGNEDLKWETDITSNIGLDFGLFQNRLSGTFDIYQRTAKDLLDFAPLPSNSAISQIAKNVGKTRSKGFELGVKGEIVKRQNFEWVANLTLSHNRSFWVERNPVVALDPWVGINDDISAIYGWKTNGLFHSLEEVQNYKSNGNILQPGSFPGNIKYVDINGDGKLDQKDVVNLGSWDPKINFGLGMTLRYKKFDLVVNTYGVLGMKTYDGWRYFLDLNYLAQKVNQSVQIMDAWTSENPNGKYSGIAINSTDSNNPTYNSDYLMQTTNYIRFKNVTLGYTFDQNLLRNNKIAQNIRLYVDFQNIALITNYVGLDPEMEKNSSPFPIPFTTAFGMNITF